MIRKASFFAAVGLMFCASAAWANGSGDCDGNGVIDQADVEITRDAIGTNSSDEGFEPEADVDGDGVISLLDLNTILQALN